MEEYGPGSDENPPGYYNTVTRPDPGASLPQPPGPRSRLLAKALGVAFIALAVAYGVHEVVELATFSGPLPRTIVAGRYLAVAVVGAVLGVLGVVLIRHADDPPTRLMRRRSRRRH